MRKLFKKTGSMILALSLVMSMFVAVAAAAGDVEIKINFQRGTDREAPEGYLIDAGAELGDRGNGWTYGWNVDHSSEARDNNQANEDRRLATHAHFMEEGQWMIELPNGTYEITASIGDSGYPTGDKGKLILEANGETLFEFAERERIETNEFATSTIEVQVTDGLLTLDSLDSAHKNIKINYIHIDSIALDEPAGGADEEPAAGEDSGSSDSGDSNAPVTQPDMPRTGMGGTSNGMTSASVVLVVLFVTALTVVVIRKRNNNEA